MRTLRQLNNACNLGDSAANIWNGPGSPSDMEYDGMTRFWFRFVLVSGSPRSPPRLKAWKLRPDFRCSFLFFSRPRATACDRAKRLAVRSSRLWMATKWNWLSRKRVKKGQHSERPSQCLDLETYLNWVHCVRTLMPMISRVCRVSPVHRLCEWKLLKKV